MKRGGVKGPGVTLCQTTWPLWTSPLCSHLHIPSLMPRKEKDETWNKTLLHHIPFFFFLFLFFFFFSRRGEPLPGFPFWCFVAGPVVKLRLRRPRELGDRAFRTVASPPPEERAGCTPQLLSKRNIVITRNRKRAFLLCTCSAVLIYLNLRWKEIMKFWVI